MDNCLNGNPEGTVKSVIPCICQGNVMEEVHVGLKSFYYPLKVFPFKSLAASLQDMINDQEYSIFVKGGGQGRCQRGTWQTYMMVGCGKNFTRPMVLLFWKEKTTSGSLNVDWLRPFDHSPYSVGDIYTSQFWTYHNVYVTNQKMWLCMALYLDQKRQKAQWILTWRW